jgi:hypothetical protein
MCRVCPLAGKCQLCRNEVIDAGRRAAEAQAGASATTVAGGWRNRESQEWWQQPPYVSIEMITASARRPNQIRQEPFHATSRPPRRSGSYARRCRGSRPGAGQVAQQTDHLHRAVRGGWNDGHPGSFGQQQGGTGPRHHLRDPEQARSRRRHGLRLHREGRAGRLHDPGWHHQLARNQRQPVLQAARTTRSRTSNPSR